jgi:ABC-type glycerol-3-phosphate transport system substrate-binding protein
MSGLKRRHLLQASVAAAGVLAAPQIKAQSKPDKIVYVGDNGPWHWVMVEEVAPAFEKATGIKVDFTLLPVDPWRARLRAELGAGSSGIDVVQWSVGMAGWIAPHMEDHEPLLAQIKSKHSEFDWNDYLTERRRRQPTTASWSVSRIASPRAYSITRGHCWNRPDSVSRRGRGTSS